MNMEKNKFKRTVSIVLITVSLIALVFFLLRGPYLSNTIKRVIIPVLENATGESIISDSAVINLFPFYFQVKSLKVFDKDGNRLLWVTKTRAYIDLLGLLSGELRIRRMTFNGPRLTASKEELDKVRSNIKRYLSVKEGGGLSLSIKNIIMTDGEYVLSGIGEINELSGVGLFADILVKNTMTVKISQKEGVFRIKDRPDLKFGLDGRMVVTEEEKVNISELMIQSSGSSLTVDGFLMLAEDGKLKGGRLSVNAKILEDTINNFFEVGDKREGELTVSGDVDLLPTAGSKWPGISLELDTSGWFYLESLMKILGVNSNINGRLAVDGQISGVYPDLSGKASGRLDKAEFGRLPLDYITGEIDYKDKRFNFDNVVAQTFHGELRGDALIKIPHGDYLVEASFKDIGSPEFFDFIGWDAPFSKGIISGNFNLERVHSHNKQVIADVIYKNASGSDNGLFERIDEFKGGIEYDESVVKVKDGIFQTQDSLLLMDGIIDLKNSNLTLELDLDSRDSNDLTAPSLTFINAPVRFTGIASGPFSDPEISGSLDMGPGSIKGLIFSNASGDVKYRVSSLSSELLSIENENSNYEISGSILFRKADKMFSYDDPLYKSKISINGGNAGMLAKAFYKELPLSGDVSGTILLEGDSDGLNGEGRLVLENFNVYGQNFDNITFASEFEPDKITLKSVVAYRGKSRLEAEGFFSFDESFRFSASSDGVDLHDIDLLNNYPVNALMSLKIEGSGTIKKPAAEFSLKLIESSLRGNKTGKGEINGSLKDEKLEITGNILDGIINAESSVTLSDKILWSLDLNFDKGRYDPIFAALLRNGHEDISATITGNANLSGIGKDVTMSSKFTSAFLGLYGYSFRNVGDIVLELAERRLSIKSFSLVGDDAELKMSGNLDIGKDFDIKVEGNLDVVPLRALYSGITSLKGKGKFNIGVVGAWESPSLTGQIDLEDGTAAMDRFPYRIGPMNGSIFLNEDRFTFESLKTGLAGGNVEVSGVGYLKELSMKRIFISSRIDGVKIRPAEGVRAVLDGNLFYETSSKGSSLTGTIDIRKASYVKRFEWKTWLLGLKETGNISMDQSSFYGDTELNIHLIGEEYIFIDNNIASAPVELDLTATGTLAKFGLVGKIEAKEGTIYFRSNEFDILDGRLDFVEPDFIAPVFHIQAETFTKGYRVKLNLDGSIDKFIMDLYSDPPLSDTEILTLLTSGQINSEESGFESGIAAGEATAILTGSLQDVIESEVNQLTGIERFEITPQTTVTGSLSPRVTVGKRFMKNKLFVVYSTSIGPTEEDIYKLEYDISRNVSIVGSRDEVGSAGVDFKYRFEFD
jgi:translocation and assembly module TamB